MAYITCTWSHVLGSFGFLVLLNIIVVHGQPFQQACTEGPAEAIAIYYAENFNPNTGAWSIGWTVVGKNRTIAQLSDLLPASLLPFTAVQPAIASTISATIGRFYNDNNKCLNGKQECFGCCLPGVVGSLLHEALFNLGFRLSNSLNPANTIGFGGYSGGTIFSRCLIQQHTPIPSRRPTP